MTTTVDNMQDVLDSRDVIARILELESERDALQDDVRESAELAQEIADDEGQEQATKDSHNEAHAQAVAVLDEWVSDNGAELAALLALQEECEGCCEDWRYGASLIRDSYFKEYAQELAEDIGAINEDATWPNTCIDWKQAARELQMDYTRVDFDGVAYWIR